MLTTIFLLNKCQTPVIIKCNTLDGNNAMYICKAGTSINDLNK